ncbi:uncharacterized protein LOC130667858 [Microplitis mediator]|uniref:uncharacterized protein LOC130667858 n=1 Tax=Microplitis mediator TaxID=375433 RepID=UPI0025553AFD|nr:uncharacterized protein LOC130667858 [Microplitis mediator]
MGFFNLSNVTIFVLLIILELNLSSGASVGIGNGSPSKLEDNGNEAIKFGNHELNLSMKATLMDKNSNVTICLKPVKVSHGNAASVAEWNYRGKSTYQELHLAANGGSSGTDPAKIEWIISDNCTSTDKLGTTFEYAGQS